MQGGQDWESLIENRHTEALTEVSILFIHDYSFHTE